MAGHFSSLLPADTGDAPRIPVTVLTGFLGSGKTTLLNRLLKLPDLSGTAVIVNEFGAVGIDHDLIAQTTDDTVLLANGCLCCAVRGDLVEALTRLAQRDEPPRQVLLETSGLADPGPILRTLMGEAGIRARFALAGVACTVDAVLGLGTLDGYREAVEQVAVADALFLTKSDLLEGPPASALLDRLTALNPRAVLHEAPGEHCDALRSLMHAGVAVPEVVAEVAPHYRPMGPMGAIGTVDPLDPPATDRGEAQGSHRDGITSFTLVRDQPLPRDAFFGWLDMMIAMRGADLLRVKGLVCLAEQPEQPLVIHGVQHLFHPPDSLPAWPSADRRTRIVFITRGVDREAMDETLSVFERRRRKRGV